MDKISLQAQPRDLQKKAKSLRTAGYVPGVVYGHGVKNVPVQIKYTDLSKAYKKAGASTLVDLKLVDGDTRTVLIHDVDRDPVSERMVHADFYQVNLKEKIEAEIPLKFIGESAAVKELEGTLISNRDHVKVKALPQDLVHEIEVDVSVLKTFDDSIHVKDIKAPQGIEILDDPEETVAVVNPPRSEEELKALEEEVKEDVEGVEVEEKGKVEEETAEGEAAAPTEQPKAEAPKKEEK